MARPRSPHPTQRELQLLKLLWAHGPSSVRDLHERFPVKPKPAYTSLQTNLQAMFEKELITRELEGRTYIYAAAVSREEVEQGVVEDMVNRVFDGSALRLITTALTSEAATPEEVERLQRLIEERSDSE